MRPPVIVMPVRRPVGMHMILAAVIVDADDDVILGQAVRDIRIIGKGEGGRRREDAKGVQQGQSHCCLAAKRFGQAREHGALSERALSELPWRRG